MASEPARYTTCLDCGEVTEIPLTPVGGTSPEARCPEHRAARNRVTRNRDRERAYEQTAWRKLSRRLRRNAACADCGSRQDLTLDHLSEEAWERHEAGLPLRPGIDVEVRCRTHNSSAGPARGPYASRG